MPPPHIRRTIRRGQEKVVVETPSGIAFALPDGALISTDEERPGVSRVEEGKPLYIRYSSFYLNLKEVSDRKTQILITTQAEADEKITKAPPFVTRWDDEASANAPTYSFRDWGAARAGHPMIFYSKAYLGETVRFTTYVWEIDRADEELFAAIGKALDTGAGLPVFLDLVPAMGAAKIALNLLQGVANWMDKDDPVIRGKDIDLGATRLLRAGRYVVSVGISEPDLIARHKSRRPAAENQRRRRRHHVVLHLRRRQPGAAQAREVRPVRRRRRNPRAHQSRLRRRRQGGHRAGGGSPGRLQRLENPRRDRHRQARQAQSSKPCASASRRRCSGRWRRTWTIWKPGRPERCSARGEGAPPPGRTPALDAPQQGA